MRAKLVVFEPPGHAVGFNLFRYFFLKRAWMVDAQSPLNGLRSISITARGWAEKVFVFPRLSAERRMNGALRFGSVGICENNILMSGGIASALQKELKASL
jgi:hypothetical protein